MPGIRQVSICSSPCIAILCTSSVEKHTEDYLFLLCKETINENKMAVVSISILRVSIMSCFLLLFFMILSSSCWALDDTVVLAGNPRSRILTNTNGIRTHVRPTTTTTTTRITSRRRLPVATRTRITNRSSLLAPSTTTSITSMVTTPPPQSSLWIHLIRGGSITDDALVFHPELLLSASFFSFLCLLYGMACLIDPRGTARVLYGHTSNNNTDDASTIKFLMRLAGSIVSGMGLTSAFSVAYDIQSALPTLLATGTTTPSSTCHASLYSPVAIAVGFLPRALLYFWYAFIKPPNLILPTNTKESIPETKHSAKFVWFFTFASTIFYIGLTCYYTNYNGSTWNTIAIITGSLLSSLFAFYSVFTVAVPSNKKQPTLHEILLTRLVLMYSWMNTVLLLSLLFVKSSFSAIGITAATYALGQYYLTFITKDVMNCSSSGWSVSMILLSLLVSLGSLSKLFSVTDLFKSLVRCPCNE